MSEFEPHGLDTVIDDPFISTPPHVQPSQALRNAPFDVNAFALGSTSSSQQVRVALEAHVKDTDKRLEETSKLGKTLVQQKKDLTARLRELNEQKDGDEIGPELRKKLAEIEKDYVDVGRETARAMLPKSRLASGQHDPAQSPAVFAGVSSASPSKAAVPSRKQRNQSSTRVHDIEFATQISTSLLVQVRELQAALVEKDDALKTETLQKAQIEADLTNIRGRMKQADDTEQRYKDENWNLETQVQDMTVAIKEANDKEQRANLAVKAAQVEKEKLHRELDDLKHLHGTMIDETSGSKRAQDSEMHNLKQDVANHEEERKQLQSKIDALMMKNTEMSRALRNFMDTGKSDMVNGVNGEVENNDDEHDLTEVTPPASPTKRMPGQSGLEAETLRASLQHSHRSIQTLKNNIHREKSEKLELKRLLQDARDELEAKRGDNKAAVLAKKRRSEQEAAKLQKAKPGQLGANRFSREEVINEPDWEDHEGDATFNTSSTSRRRKLSIPGVFTPAEESTDAFETANEKGTATETEAFMTGVEDLHDEDSGDATETESAALKATRPQQRYPSLISAKRASYQSTASTSADEDESHTPMMQSRYRLKNMKPRSFIREQSVTSSTHSPAMSQTFRQSSAVSSMASSAGTPIAAGQSLGDELVGLSDDESTVDGTPSKRLSPLPTPSKSEQTFTQLSVSPVLVMIDIGTMTDSVEVVHNSRDSLKATELLDTEAPVDSASSTPPISHFNAFSRKTFEDIKPQEASVIASTPKGFSAFVLQNTAPTVAQSPNSVYPPHHSYGAALSQYYSPHVSPERNQAHAQDIVLETSPIKSQQYAPVELGSKETDHRKRQGSLWTQDLMQSMIHIPNTSPEVRSSEEFEHISYTSDSDHDHRETDKGPKFESSEPRMIADGEIEKPRSSSEVLDYEQAFSHDMMSGQTPLGIITAVPQKAQPLLVQQTSPRRLSEPEKRVAIPATSPTRPGSAGGVDRMKNPASLLPAPLVISQNNPIRPVQSTPGLMGPPLMTSAAYKLAQQQTSIQTRPATSTNLSKSASIRTAPHTNTMPTRRSSFSSFASEMDHRINPSGNFSYPYEGESATDPRMIAAITQAMIGEYLWKYTRSPMSSSTISSNRHRRFFWVHPYTRTLYWSDTNPSTAGKSQLKAKSVAIEAVRQMNDVNAYPPGLHRKSIVVVTPAREIVFTAPTAQRHETWYNALSYLLLRTASTEDANTSVAVDGMVASPLIGPNGEVIDDDDIAEFNPRSRRFDRQNSLSINTRQIPNGPYASSLTSPYTTASSTTSRNRPHPFEVPTLTTWNNSSTRSRSASPSKANIRSTSPIKSPTTPSMRGRIGSVFSSTSRRARTSLSGTSTSHAPETLDAGYTHKPATGLTTEELRAQIEASEREDRMENVRTCCDGKSNIVMHNHFHTNIFHTGKHDVGSLSNRSESLRDRVAAHGVNFHLHHHHPHNHANSTASQPTSRGSMSSRT